jgi:hypothetical protein
MPDFNQQTNCEWRYRQYSRVDTINFSGVAICDKILVIVPSAMELTTLGSTRVLYEGLSSVCTNPCRRAACRKVVVSVCESGGVDWHRWIPQQCRSSIELSFCLLLRGRIPKGLLQRTKGYSSVESTIRGILFGTHGLIYFQLNSSPYISHDTDTKMTHYDTGGTEIP